MEELIKITEQDGRRAVSARELHEFLESKQQFADWIKNRIEQYGLVENEDFVVFHKSMKNLKGGRPQIEYALTLDCAKELAMVEGNDRGRQARRYFIERDKELRNIEQGKFFSGRYDASRNILPGVHSPEARMIGEHAIWTICIDNTLFYSLKDILNAAGMYEHKRKETSRNWFRSYVYWINDRTGTCPKRYINEAGVLFLFSRTRANKGDPRARQFLGSFTRQARENEGKIKTARLENIRMEETNGEINLNEFLDIIITIQDDNNRRSLYDMYKKLSWRT